MIKSVIAIASVGLFLSSVTTFSEENLDNVHPEVFEWTRTEDNFWMGKDYQYYRLDSNKVLEFSKDRNHWKDCTVAVWTDRLGNKICYKNNKLWQSFNDTDWEYIPEQKWQSINGNWYQIDIAGNLWTSTANPE